MHMEQGNTSLRQLEELLPSLIDSSDWSLDNSELDGDVTLGGARFADKHRSWLESP